MPQSTYGLIKDKLYGGKNIRTSSHDLASRNALIPSPHCKSLIESNFKKMESDEDRLVFKTRSIKKEPRSRLLLF